METLKQKLCSINDYQEMEKTLQDISIINIAEQFLITIKLSHTINTKDFLTIFPIYKFPKSLIGDIDIEPNNEILEHCNKIIETEFKNDDELKLSIVNFIYHFKKWKDEDKGILIYHLFEEYHQLSVDILNTNDSEKQLILKKCKKDLLDTAKLIGGDKLIKEITNYRAVISNNINFQKEYDKAYWKLLKEEYNNNNYLKCCELILFIKNVIFSIGNVCDKVEYNTKEILNNLEQSNSDFIIIKTWSLCIYDYIKTIQSPVHDMKLESFKRDLHIKEIYLPTILKNIFFLVKNVIYDFEEIKKKMSNN